MEMGKMRFREMGRWGEVKRDKGKWVGMKGDGWSAI
jgi:hypothetical protein